MTRMNLSGRGGQVLTRPELSPASLALGSMVALIEAAGLNAKSPRSNSATQVSMPQGSSSVCHVGPFWG